MARPKVYSSVGLVQGRFHEEVLVCQFTQMTSSQGSVWFGGDLWGYSLPVLLVQLSLIIILTRAIFFLIRPLKQSMITAQLIAGIIMGRSFLGRYKAYSEKLFPPGGRLILEIFADIGFMFHLFILGVRVDATMVKRVRRNVALIGISSFVLPYALGGLAIFLLPRVMIVDESIENNLPFVTSINSITSFPVITSLLADLQILNSEVGRIATWAAMFSDFCGYTSSLFVMSVGVSIRTSDWGNMLNMVWSVGFLLFVIFGLRPLLIFIGNRIPAGQHMKESQFLSIVLIVLLSGLCAEALGQPAALGTFILGVAVPDGPPLGSALVHKLDTLSTGVLLPAKFAISGLSMDLFSIGGGSRGIILEFVILLGYVGKFMGTLIPALCFRVPFWEAFTLSLIMCCKGVIEASVYIMMKENGNINNEAYALLLITMLITTGITRPLIWYLYDPSARYVGYRTNSIMFTDPHDELRLLVCIHKDDNVPTIINLLEASNPMRHRPLSILVLNLLELQGRAAAMLVPNSSDSKLSNDESRSEHVANAFKNFALRKQGSVLLEHFTSIAPYASMHDDICTVALDRGANIVIIPFHKQWAINGDVGASFPSIRMVNQNVLQKAPCSIGVLIDRGQIAGNQSMITGKSMFRVVMLFLGGSDDCEALAYSSRLAEHPRISFTFLWLRLCDDKNYGNDAERTFDLNMIDRFRTANADNQRVIYKEEMVRDAVGTTRILRSIEDSCDLCIVGRQHDAKSPLTLGLTEWSECPELGFIGDLLAASDFQFSVLIVQHQAPDSELSDNTLPQPVPSRVASTRMHEDPCNSEDVSVNRNRSIRSSASSRSIR